MNLHDFDDIRPFTDGELPEALQRIAGWDLFTQVIRYIYPDLDADEARERLCAIKTVYELQSTIMNDAIKRIVAMTTSKFSFSGMNHLRRGGNYLFVSNHRDITLDAFLLQHLLYEQKGDTSYIVFGNNLLSSPIMSDLFRCNKLIQMGRGGNPRQFYESLKHLSTYIRALVVEERQSVWIAQRNGRNKDGIDATAPAMLKMLMLSSDDESAQSLADLNIVPMSISYEWDPCDIMKTCELFQRRRGDYVKAKDEDLNSVVTGIIAPKGHVHLAIGSPLTKKELDPPAGEHLTEYAAAVLDRHIQKNYHLMPTNYLAYDMMKGDTRYKMHYSASVRRDFAQRLSQLPDEEHRQIMIEMYANPVVTSLRAGGQRPRKSGRRN